MRYKNISNLSLITLTLSLVTAQAAVTQRWVVETSRVQPVVFDAVRGETLSLEAAFQSYGKSVAMPTNGWCMLWQTNGMGSAWWSAGASCEREAKEEGQGQQWNGSSSSALYPLSSTNYVVKAVFTPAMDPGADTVIGFLGATGQNYRASFRLRFRHGPGAAPSVIQPPVRTLDFSTTTVSHPEDAPFVMKGGSGGVTDRQAGTIATNTVNAKVAPWAMSGQPKPSSGGITTNDVNAIIASSNLCTVAAAQAMTNAVSTTTEENFLKKSGPNEQSISYNEYGPQIDFNATVSKFSSYALFTSPSKIAFGEDISYGLPAYLDSLSWRTTGSRTLAEYGITDAYTKTQADETFLKKSGPGNANIAWGNDGKLTVDGTITFDFYSCLDIISDESLGSILNERVNTYEANQIARAAAASSLSGKTYDFANGSNFTKRVYAALTNVIQALGGTVTNAPRF